MGSRLLDGCRNMYGPLAPDIRRRIAAYLAAPSVDGWDDVHSIIVSDDNPRCRTLWQAVIAVDPSFPRTGAPEPAGKRITAQARWRGRFPDAVTVARAIRLACSCAVAQTEKGA